MDQVRRHKYTPEEAKQWLLDHGFIQLPPNSYFNWIQADRFKMYKPVLSFRNGSWIPHINRLAELARLDQIYKEQDFKTYGGEMIGKEIVNSIAKAAEKEETYTNSQGDTLPF